jgi:hypothetical protein
MTPDIVHINRRFAAGKRDQVAGHRTPEQLARACLVEARSDPDKAIALARRHVHGRELRATIAAIGSAFLRASGGAP